jgi:hypothetical protein
MKRFLFAIEFTVRRGYSIGVATPASDRWLFTTTGGRLVEFTTAAELEVEIGGKWWPLDQLNPQRITLTSGWVYAESGEFQGHEIAAYISESIAAAPVGETLYTGAALDKLALEFGLENGQALFNQFVPRDARSSTGILLSIVEGGGSAS